MAETILWHDYETTGIDPRRDRPMQFAAIRTDLELQEIDAPIELCAKVGEDALMAPEACLVTGLTPLRNLDRALVEIDFAREVHAIMNVPGTCAAGYNSFRFDDEVTRFTFWRSLLPVYDREFRDGNSRWDLIDPIRAAYALRPRGIEWPLDADGMPSFKLERLAAANGIEHVAHDAVGDVRATIALARLMRRAQPKMFDHLFEGRRPNASTARFESLQDAPFVHTSGRMPREFACSSVLAFVTRHPTNNRERLCLDLRHDPAVLLRESLDTLRHCIYTRRDEQAPDAPRVGVKSIRLNHAPVLAPLGVLEDDAAWARLGLDPAEVKRRHAFVVANHGALRARLCDLQQRPPDLDATPLDPDVGLYGKGFVSNQDAATCRSVHTSPPTQWQEIASRFEDPRLAELLFRARARCHPETLSAAETTRWREHCRARWLDPSPSGEPAATTLLASLEALRLTHAADPKAIALLDELERFTRERIEGWCAPVA